MLEGPIARNKLKRDVNELFCKEKFDELEQIANDLRKTKSRFPEGHWKLEYYYEGLSTPEVTGEVQWKLWLEKMEKWQHAFPNSITARVAFASAWLSYGWQARGTGYANTVSKEGWEKLSERTARALSLVKEQPRRDTDDCPGRYAVLLTIARDSGWNREIFFNIFKRAIMFEPKYYSYYAIATDYLTSRWYGHNNEWIKFVDNSDLIAGNEGNREIYTRLMIGMWQREWKTFDGTYISWAKMKKGFEDIERNYHNSKYNLNNFCLFACLAGDKETARKLFLRIGDNPYIASWNNAANFIKWKSWAEDRIDLEKNGSSFQNIKSEDFIETMQLAQRGDVDAQFQVGFFFEKGEHVARDYREAESWYRKAAEKGYPDAMIWLASLYFNGNDVIKKDLNEAEKWYLLSALKGYDDNGPQLLGFMYQHGIGHEKNLIKAYIWYSQIFRFKDQNIEKIATELTPSQLNQAEQKAKILREKILKNRNSLLNINRTDSSSPNFNSSNIHDN